MVDTMKVENTRNKILDTARQLVQTRSFHGFSFQDIANTIGVRKPSLYHHFASKDALAIALLEDYRAEFREFIQQIQYRPVPEQLDGYFAVFADFLHAGEQICPGAAFIAGWGSINEPVKQQVDRLIHQHQNWLTKVVKQGRETGELRDYPSAPEDEALWIYATLQGGLLMARASGQQAVFKKVISLLRAAVIAN
jgi:TetR/AcrR family transcriptional repressor of nem operon